MFIVCNIDVNSDKVSIFDSKDNSLDTVSLSQIANKINQGKLKVYGLRKGIVSTSDCIPIPMLRISICNMEAKKAMYRYFISKGLNESDARRKVGI